MFKEFDWVTEILSKHTLISKLSSGCKSRHDWKIGTEHEKFGFKKKDLSPISFEDIQRIFAELIENYNWLAVKENEKIVELRKNSASITLEPGGQIELSGAPMENLFQTCKEVNLHQDELNNVCSKYDIDFMGIGVLPKWNLNDLKLMPKERYKIMSNYMPKVGEKGLDMMMRTTTIQANFDFSSEKDMVRKLRVSQSIQPLVIALYANSPFIDGKLTEYLSYRSYIWTKTDPSRCGILPFIYEEDFSFERYVDYLLEVPMYFIIRDKKYIDLTGYTFKAFLEKKIIKKYEPELKDWDIHITTVFPEVRLKSFIELRGVDGGPWSRVCALPAFWTGILYDNNVLNEVSELVSDWTFNDIQNLYDNVRKYGLKTHMPGGEKLTEFTKKILNLSSSGLRNRKIEFSGKNEETFLEPLRKILSQGDSPAEIWKNLYINQWSKDINMLYKNNYFKVTNDQT